MPRSEPHQPDPKLDLVLERTIDVPRDLVWAAWTQPEHITHWFTPAPWKTVECQIDLRPGGMFRFVMLSPEGEKFPYVGCYLEVIEKELLVWTMALAPGYRPVVHKSEVPTFTAIIAMESVGSGTKYKAIAIHKDESDCQTHAKMGFHDGWGAALNQLIAHAKTMKS